MTIDELKQLTGMKSVDMNTYAYYNALYEGSGMEKKEWATIMMRHMLQAVVLLGLSANDMDADAKRDMVVTEFKDACLRERNARMADASIVVGHVREGKYKDTYFVYGMPEVSVYIRSENYSEITR